MVGMMAAWMDRSLAVQLEIWRVETTVAYLDETTAETMAVMMAVMMVAQMVALTAEMSDASKVEKKVDK